MTTAAAMTNGQGPTWFAQVFHVMRKDIRELRQFLVVYVLALTASVVHALHPFDRWNSFVEASILLVFVLGMLIVAALIHADSPTRADAFWITRPLNSITVLAAKIATTVIVVMGLGILAQAVVLQALSLPAGTTLPLLANSVRIYGLWLIVAMVIAVPTRDLRTFIVVLSAILFALLVSVVSLLAAYVDMQTGAARIVSGLVGLAGGLVFVFHFYRVRDPRRAALFAGLVPVFCIWVHLVSSTGGQPSKPSHITTAFDLVAHRTDTQLMLNLRVDVKDGRPGEEYALDHAHLQVYGPDSSPVTMQLYPHNVVVGSNGTHRISLSATDQMPSSVDSVIVSGDWYVRERLTSRDTPARAGESWIYDGRHISIIDLRPTSVDLLTLRTTWVEKGFDPGTSTGSGGDLTQVYLRNDERHESIALHPDQSTGNASIAVLPGITIHRTTDSYKASTTSLIPYTMIDAKWLGGAHLEISRMGPKGVFRTKATSLAR